MYIEVTRPNGIVEYFESIPGHGYSPVGGGQLVASFNKLARIKIIDSIPENFQMGMCGFDEPMYRCICDPNDVWNGWAKPYIFADDIEKFLNDIRVNEYEKSCMEDGKLKIVSEYEDDKPTTDYVEKQILFGIEVYNVGGLGWTFDFFANGKH